MKVQLVKAATSNILTVFILDSSSSVGAGLGSLDQTSSIVGGYVRAGATGVALAVDENVTTEGTYEAPSSAAQVRIGTPANMTSGTYELHFHNDLFATGADILTITLGGASNMAPTVIEVQLTDVDMNTAIVDGSGRTDVGRWLGTAVTVGNSAPDVNIASTDDIALSTTQKANVNTEADLALTDINLDHLMKTSTASATDLTTEVADNTVMAYLLTNDGNTSDYDDSTMSQEALAAGSRHFKGTATGSSTTTKVFVQAGDPPSGGADDDYNDTIIAVWRGTDKVTARVNLRVVTDYDDSDPSFTVDTALGFTPLANDIVEVYIADSGALASLSKLTTGFGTTSPDTLEAYLLAIMSKTATTPANAGTYSAATDSLEFMGERNALIEGSSFGTATDSLAAIRDAIDTLVAPAVVGASSLSGSGFLSDCVTMIRRMTDEPSLLPKYTDADLVEAVTSAMTVVMSEVHNNSDHNILCRFNIQLVTGQQTYILPPNVGEIWAVRKMSTTTPVIPIYEAWPDNHWSSHQSGFVIEHNEFRLLTDWRSTDILEILYIPNGESFIHKATASSVAASQIIFPTTVTDGTLDTRQNAYAGYLCRILSNTDPHIQERILASYDNITRKGIPTTPFDPVPSGTVVYEVLPTYGWLIKDAVCLQAAMDVLANEGNTKRLKTQTIRYNVKMRALRQMIAKKSSRFGGHMEGDTSDNDERGGFYGWLVL